MAEFLQRHPTSIGNRQKWTLSGWIKINNDFGSSNYNTIWSVAAGTSSNNSDRYHLYHYTDGRWAVTGTTSLSQIFTLPSGSSAHSRDPSSWMHFCLSLDTTIAAITTERVHRFWINGVEYETTALNLGGNNKLAINGPYQHYIGVRDSSATRASEVQIFDMYFVDGQTLTADDFGFNKDGDGYISAGGIKSTDFREGQWVPRAPRQIKKTVNDIGGFGQNGFYLPMNDSSNPGADFHCDSNSIITLKGENLPQPRNGAPETTDDFVSQLRQETGELGFDGVVKFDGAGDYLSLPKASFQMLHKLTSSWTIEGYIFKTVDAQGTIFDTGGSSSATIGTAVYINSGGDFRLRIRQALSGIVVSENLPGSIALNRWQHIAVSYDGTSIRIFVEGRLLKTVSYNTQSSTDSSADFNIGVYDAVGGGGLSGYFNGFISNLRVLDGTALYTSDFTVPTEPLTNVTNTKLLCCNSTKSPESATVAPTIGTYVQNWTENTSSGLDSYNGISAIYDGQLGASNRGGNSSSHDGSYETLFDGQSVSVSSTIEIYWNGVGAGQRVIRVNGTTEINGGSSALTPGWDSHSFSGTVTKLEVKTANTGSYGIAAVKIDDNILTTPLESYGDVFATRNELSGSIVLAIPFISGGQGTGNHAGAGDYSADIKGNGTNKSVTLNGSFSVDECHSYYGSALKSSSGNRWVSVAAHADFANLYDIDHTVEFWYKNDDWTGGYFPHADIIGLHVPGSGNAAFRITFTDKNSTNEDGIQLFGDHTMNTGDHVLNNNWNHCAVVQENGFTSIYVNGVACHRQGNRYGYQAHKASTGPIIIGADPRLQTQDGSSYRWGGQLQDIRIYKGVAKYRGGFDVPNPYYPVNVDNWRTVSDNCKNNFCTWNPLDDSVNIGSQGNISTLSDGNLTSGTDSNASVHGTVGVTSGKWYYESMFSVGHNNADGLGFVAQHEYGVNGTQLGGYGIIMRDNGGFYLGNGQSRTDPPLGTATRWLKGDIMGTSIDIEKREVKFYKNGNYVEKSTYSFPSHIDDTAVWMPCVLNRSSGYIYTNFGQNPTFIDKQAVDRNRLNTSNSNNVWHQSSNPSNYPDWNISNDGKNLSVTVPSGAAARAYLLEGDGTIDPKKKYLVSFNYVTGPSNLGVQAGSPLKYLTSTSGSSSPGSLSSGNKYAFIVQGNQFAITGFQNSTYELNNFVVSEITEGYSDVNGKGKFAFEPPSGFLALCEDNLPTPAIADPGEHFKTVLYRGDDTNGHSITGVGFQPDLVWIKERGPGSSSHQWHDSVRGAGNILMSNSTEDESYSATYLYSLDSDGFTLGTSGGINASTDDYVAWCWKAGGAAVSNTDGSIASQVSANQTAGFSIVSYTANQTSGATVGHGLSSTPKWIIVKERSPNNNNWTVYHAGTGNTIAMYLDLPNSSSDFLGAWNDTSPTSSVFSLGNSAETNRNNSSYIAYCWSEIEGFSKFGKYEGDADTAQNGPFVYCGFKPAWIMLKNSDSSGAWVMMDSARCSANPNNNHLLANASNPQSISNMKVDFLSNGFRITNLTTNYTDINGNHEKIIFAAFAESPFKTANAK